VRIVGHEQRLPEVPAAAGGPLRRLQAEGEADQTQRAIMTSHQLTILVLPDLLAVCKLAPNAPVPLWASASGFTSITRTSDELSIVCRQEAVPEGIKCERGWRCLRVAGTIDFGVVGVLASLVTPLAEARIGVFVISTFDTDFLLVKATDLDKAVVALRRASHRVE
jgi:hypothetical protein